MANAYSTVAANEYSLERAQVVCDRAESKYWPPYLVKVAIQLIHWQPGMECARWALVIDRLSVELSYDMNTSRYVKKSGEYARK